MQARILDTDDLEREADGVISRWRLTKRRCPTAARAACRNWLATSSPEGDVTSGTGQLLPGLHAGKLQCATVSLCESSTSDVGQLLPVSLTGKLVTTSGEKHPVLAATCHHSSTQTKHQRCWTAAACVTHRQAGGNASGDARVLSLRDQP
eukprot:1161707-Pelagomonas_calceolata.AAC.4